MLEIVKLKGNAPLLLEVSVPPLCVPLLVGNPKGTSLLTWVERASSKDTIMTWGIEATPEAILSEMVKMALDRSSSEGWGVRQKSFADAEKRLLSLGIDQIQVSNTLVHPKAPSLLGSLILAGNKCFPVIHNIGRGLCVVSGV